jgi:hypothetical protein
MNKEQIYDEQISPLMKQIIKICQDNGIAMIFSASLPTEEEPGCTCTSIIPDQDGKSGTGHMEALRHIKGAYSSSSPVMFTVIRADGSKSCEAII